MQYKLKMQREKSGILIKFLVMSKYLSVLMLLLILQYKAAAQQSERIVQMAKIEVDPARLDKYKANLKEEIETSIRIEPGVLSLQAVADKNEPTHITILETYENDVAYQSHLKSPHFLKYKAAVKDIVKRLELIRVNSIASGIKPNK
jgi:quinol monooxygenase YgiN